MQLCLALSSNSKVVVEILNVIWKFVMEWMRATKLKLNPDKKVLVVGSNLVLGSGNTLGTGWFHTHAEGPCWQFGVAM